MNAYEQNELITSLRVKFYENEVMEALKSHRYELETVAS